MHALIITTAILLLPVTLAAPAQACADVQAFGEASGCVAISGTGKARGSYIAIAGAGEAHGGLVAVVGAGEATSYHLAIAGTGTAEGEYEVLLSGECEQAMEETIRIDSCGGDMGCGKRTSASAPLAATTLYPVRLSEQDDACSGTVDMHASPPHMATPSCEGGAVIIYGVGQVTITECNGNVLINVQGLPVLPL